MHAKSVRFLLVSAFLTAIPPIGNAQPAGSPQPPAATPAPCVVSSDPQYGFVKEKAIGIGGGAMYVAARERRYLGALRGPEGQPLRFERRGSTAVDPAAPDPTILDLYQVTYQGRDKPVDLFLDAYHYGTPRAPQGFTCGAPLVAALGPPPVDPFKASASIAALAIEQAAAGREFAAVPLDAGGQGTHGVVLDQFRMIVVKAKAAISSGVRVDPNKPPQDLARQGLVVVAYPLTCGGREVAPDSVEIVSGQGAQPPRVGDFMRGDAIAALLPGITVPPRSVAASYGLAFLRPGDRVKITYLEPCDDGSREALLSAKFEPPRPVATTRAALPAGIVEADPVVVFQAIIDMDGTFAHAASIGGPPSLLIPALEVLGQWRAAPLLVNGAPVVSPIVIPVVFR
jgi:hypothetical protein